MTAGAIVRADVDPVLVRPARPSDADALAAMFDRCSPETRYQRFHGVVGELPGPYLHDFLHAPSSGHIASVTELVRVGDAEGTPSRPAVPHLVAMAGAGPVPDAPHVYELGVLVEDGWQRRGLGRTLLGDLFAGVYAAGVATMRMQLARSRPELVNYLLANCAVVNLHSAGQEVVIDVDVVAYALAAAAVSPTGRGVAAPRPPERRAAARARRPRCSAVRCSAAPGPA
jgi:GNAT superfamily N-acetyltransferase